MARFHPPAVDPLDWMLTGPGADRPFDGVQLRAVMAPDGVIDIGVVGSTDPDFRRLSDGSIIRRDFENVPAYSSGVIVGYGGRRLAGYIDFAIDDRPTLAQATIGDWRSTIAVYIDRRARPMSGHIEAHCTDTGIEVTASPDMDDQSAASALKAFANWRISQARQARWQRDGWNGQEYGFSPDTLFSAAHFTVPDDGEGIGPGASGSRTELRNATHAQLVAAMVEFIARRFQDPNVEAAPTPSGA